MNRLLILFGAAIFLSFDLSAQMSLGEPLYGFNVQCLKEEGAKYVPEAGYCPSCASGQRQPLGRSIFFSTNTTSQRDAELCNNETFRALYLNSRCKIKHPILDLMANNGCNSTCCLPVASESNWRVSSSYGFRSSPTAGASTNHPGLDFAYLLHTGDSMDGVPVRAAKAGRVTLRGRKGGYGNTVEIDHGSQYTRYAHLQNCRQFQAVSVGQRVRKGQVIGCVGDTGISSGPHLHFEIRRKRGDVDLNPLRACSFRGLECRKRP